MKREAAILASVLFLLLTGCTTKVWKNHYVSMSTNRYPPTDQLQIQFEEVEYDLLRRTEYTEGFEIIGKSEFRCSLVGTTPGAPGSSLREQAAKIGAEWVKWAERPVGTRGSISDGEGSVSTIADYYAVYYRRH